MVLDDVLEKARIDSESGPGTVIRPHSAGERLRINFVLPPAPAISGGPLAILEYANRFIDRGHAVSITTYPDTMWTGENPFPWFDFKGPVLFKRLRGGASTPPSVSVASLQLMGRDDFKALSDAVFGSFGIEGLREIVMRSCGDLAEKLPFEFLVHELLVCMHTMEVMPPCDLNIATLWTTAFPVFFSRKGKPVHFMQHYEEVFVPLQPAFVLHRLGARFAHALPMYKVANSSWLQGVIRERFGQEVPFSNNGFVLSDFNPQPKKSASDGIVRVFTYSRPEEWKGFADAVAAMSMVKARYGSRIEWNVFGYAHPDLREDNPYARYTYHPKLPFAELAKLYAVSDIALCPSWFESFPLPPLEAMASGTAVVTTNYGTEDYAVHDENALVVGTRRVDDMAAAICRLVENESERHRLAAAGRKTAERFTWELAVQRREKILFDIHHGKTEYDVMTSAKLGLKDSMGIEFESAPHDINARQPGLFWHQGHLYFLHKGVKRHVATADVIPFLLKLDLQYIEIDNLTAVRTPSGFPITTAADVPSSI